MRIKSIRRGGVWHDLNAVNVQHAEKPLIRGPANPVIVGHEEALPSSLPAVATSAVELLAKWNLRGAVIESAARSIDQGSSAVDSAIGRPPSSPKRKLSRMATVPPPWAARRMVDEIVQTDPASSPDADTTGDLENVNAPSRNHVRRTRTTSHSPSAPMPTQPTHRKAQRSVSPSTSAPRHRSPSASGRRDEPPAEKGGFFFLPIDTASASTRRPVAPPNLVRRSQPNQAKSPSTHARSNSISRSQRPTATPSGPTARPTPPTRSTPAPSRAPTNARPIAPVKPPTSFTVPAVGSIFPVDSDKVQRMVTVAQSALADDFCAIFSSDDEDDTSTDGNTTESVDAVRFPSKATNVVDRKHEGRSRDARMGMGKEWYKTEWAARDRAGADQGQSGAADKDDDKDAEASGGM
ncbi:hypothetical protein BCR44DRAFT_1217253 [Catenaria anguillulae PL171]|uniref:Uncharacterized protein n=1 Tax=Catenaria anguillulae PL171 TaxID=765915 RepID=A0A1Y2I3B5_9FUNG|nr:hypothetical protein BCR44DRAFT_1217253 [Catenaria anguillulae PL171]